MKKIVILTFLLLIVLCANAQGNYKYGVVSKDNKEVVPMVYDYIDNFINGFAKVSRKGKMGLIDTKGKETVPCLYDDIKDIEDGMVVVAKGNRYGVINAVNDTIIPIKNLSVTNYREGSFLVVSDNYMFGIIDSTGRITVPFTKSIGVPYSGDDRYIITTRTDKSEQKIIDRNNNEVYSFPGYGVRDLNNGYLGIWKKTVSDRAAMYLNMNSPETIVTYKIVDIEGNEINPSLTMEYNLVFNNGLSRISRDNKTGVINIKGQQLIPCAYSRIYDFKDGYAKVRQDTSFLYGPNKYGMVNDKGKLIIPCLYDGLGDVADGYILALLNQKYGYLNTSGQTVIALKYDFAQSFENGYAVVGSKNKLGVIDKSGKVIIPIIYDQIKAIDKNYFIVTQNLQSGIIDIKGNIHVPLIYKAMTKLSDSNFIASQKDQGWGVIDVKGNEIIPFKYNEIVSCSNGMFVVQGYSAN